MKENPDIYEKKFDTINFLNEFHVRSLKLFSPQLNDRSDSDSTISTLLSQFLNQNRSLDILHEPNVADAEKLKNEVVNVFTQTEFDKSSETEVSENHNFSATHGYFGIPENFRHNSATFLSSPKLDADDEVSPKTETLQIKYESSD